MTIVAGVDGKRYSVASADEVDRYLRSNARLLNRHRDKPDWQERLVDVRADIDLLLDARLKFQGDKP